MSYYLWIVVSTYIPLWLTSHHFFPDGEAFTCRPGRESTRRSKRVPRGGRLLSQLDCDFSEVQIRKETIIGLEVGKDQWMQWRYCGLPSRRSECTFLDAELQLPLSGSIGSPQAVLRIQFGENCQDSAS